MGDLEILISSMKLRLMEIERRDKEAYRLFGVECNTTQGFREALNMAEMLAKEVEQ